MGTTHPHTHTHIYIYIYIYISVADPGFPVGGRGPIRGVVDLQCGCFLAKMEAKTKEFGPVGRHAPGTPQIRIYIYIYILAATTGQVTQHTHQIAIKGGYPGVLVTSRLTTQKLVSSCIL